jgi:hypothetical protein
MLVIPAGTVNVPLVVKVCDDCAKTRLPENNNRIMKPETPNFIIPLNI